MSAPRLILPSQLLVESLVLLDVAAESKKRVFEEISLAVENADGPNRGKVFSSLLDRERLGSTMIQRGVAIPHAKVDDLAAPIVAYLRAKEPFQYDGPEDRVKHLFVLLAPDKASDIHLKILSIMSRILSDGVFIEAADACADRRGMLRLIADWERRSLPPNILDGSAAAG
ncbi:MAG: PTS sugar transporter subunit IIA [Betaproteobacteria bacterium AqS2]|uniref:PTS sugar transporter subunit IIA n=1 Tax=Candidatus Amphirhobacter heronislandensis TaxID=1732024 RepID=A0A930UFX3_9GAMM|nr:PTS sugar transporter subunit IIA [Betaproteobacteria bacterium AqS2]